MKRVTIDDDRLEILYEAGLPLVKIAQHLGCGRTRVSEEVRKLGLTRPDPDRGLRGPDSPHWRGGRRRNGHGYVSVLVGSDYPGAHPDGYIREHRFVMQEALGRPLLDDEVVHHINGVKDDNRLSNLELMTRGKHNQHHWNTLSEKERQRRSEEGGARLVACVMKRWARVRAQRDSSASVSLCT